MISENYIDDAQRPVRSQSASTSRRLQLAASNSRTIVLDQEEKMSMQSVDDLSSAPPYEEIVSSTVPVVRGQKEANVDFEEKAKMRRETTARLRAQAAERIAKKQQEEEDAQT